MNRSQKKGFNKRESILVSAEICGSCYYRKSIPAVLHAGRFCDCGKTLGTNSLAAVGSTSIIIYFVLCEKALQHLLS